MEINNASGPNEARRPKRSAAQRANAFHYHDYAGVLCWSEEKELKKALLASLQEAKKNSTSRLAKKAKTAVSDNADDNSHCSKQTTNNNTQSDGKQTSSLPDGNSSLSLLANRRPKNPAQRKFAQGSANNSPIATPVKINVQTPTRLTDLFPKQKPKTEDFLTFLCLRGTSVLPPTLDFSRLNNEKKKQDSIVKTNSDSEISLSDDEMDQTPIRDSKNFVNSFVTKQVDKKPGHLIGVSKTLVVSNKINLQTPKKVEVIKEKEVQQRASTKSVDKTKRQEDVSKSPIQSESKKHCNVKLAESVTTQDKHNQSRVNLNKINSSTAKKDKGICNLKEKYKKQRIARNSVVETNRVKQVKKAKIAATPLVGMQTRSAQKQMVRINEKMQLKSIATEKTKKPDKVKPKLKPPVMSKRVLRSSHHHHPICTHTNKGLKLHQMNRRKRRSSPVGIRPHKRKAKPVFSLGDIESEDESDSNSEGTLKKRKRILSLNSCKSNATQTKSDKLSRNSEILKERTRLLKTSAKSTEIRKTKQKNVVNVTRRVTRSAKRDSSPTKPTQTSIEREKIIKQKIIEIEKKHKQMRRFPSDQSLHSSTSSSTSSESLPTSSSSSSSSINIPRLTRSLEHLKRIRDIAAKLKKEQKKRKEKKLMAKEKNKKLKAISKTNNNRSQKQKTVSKVKKNLRNTKTVMKAVKKSKDRKLTNKSIKKEKIMTRSQKTKRKNSKSLRVQVKSSKYSHDDESDLLITEGSMTSNFDEDMERASIVLQDMAEEINNTLDDVTNEVAHSVPDLVYGNSSREHIQGLMTSEFSGAFAEETVSTASAMLLPSNSANTFYIHHVDVPTQTKNTADASTNTTEEDILECLNDDANSTFRFELSVGTQTIEQENESKRYLKNK